MEEYCICGHGTSSHLPLGWDLEKDGCGECEIDTEGDDAIWVHPFKLDNLKLIEDLAKKRGLV